MTMSLYTYVQSDQVTNAVNALPDFNKQVQLKTGTDDKPVYAIGFEVAEKNIPKITLVCSAFDGNLSKHGKNSKDVNYSENRAVVEVKQGLDAENSDKQ